MLLALTLPFYLSSSAVLFSHALSMNGAVSQTCCEANHSRIVTHQDTILQLTMWSSHHLSRFILSLMFTFWLAVCSTALRTWVTIVTNKLQVARAVRNIRRRHL
ncbi:hypothetical protein F5Y08DRAFT_321834 [Xylaria arbuscula]|nr:hypothetical protein F5Y08DRAFT_321834 [Xylaria arbuscula]